MLRVATGDRRSGAARRHLTPTTVAYTLYKRAPFYTSFMVLMVYYDALTRFRHAVPATRRRPSGRKLTATTCGQQQA